MYSPECHLSGRCSSECHLDTQLCRSCGSILFESKVQCNHNGYEQISGEHPGIDEPSLEIVLKYIFGMSTTGFEVCICVMDAGEVTVEEIASKISASRTTVSRHIHHLVDMGVVESKDRILEDGGRITVYSTASQEIVRQRLMRGLCYWMTEAVCRVDNLTEEKVREIGDIRIHESDGESDQQSHIIHSEKIDGEDNKADI